MIPRLDIEFPLRRQWEYWFGAHLLLDLSEDKEVCMWIASMLGISVIDNRQKDKTMQLTDIQEKIKNIIVNN